MLVSLTIKHKQSKVHMKGNVLLLSRLFHHFNVIFMVPHSPWLLITNHSSFGWNYINSQESWLDGSLSFKNMILI
jgi:hypothetical protein